MATLGNTRDLATFLARQAEALANYASPLAKELAAIADAFGAIEPIGISELKKLPALLAGAKAAAARSARPPRTAGTPIATETDSVFAEALDRFIADCRGLAQRFDAEGAAILARVRERGDAFVAAQPDPARRLAARLAAIAEVGGLKSLRDGKPWWHHGLGGFSNEHEASAAMAQAKKDKLSSDDLKTAARLYLGAVPRGARPAIEKALIDEVVLRATSR